MSNNFDLTDLQAFRAVAEMRNFRKAAESLCLSQPAFSRRIDKLEQALGVRLLERTTHSVALTAVGREFESRVRGILDELDDTLLSVRGVAASRMGEVVLACVPSAAYYYLPQVLRLYRAVCPRVRVHVLDAGANQALAAVSQGDADFGLNFLGSQEGELEFEPLVDEAFVVACYRGHPLARRKQVRWSELAEHDHISVSRSSGNRLLIDQALAGAPRRPQAIYETEHVTTTLGLVEAGLGLAVVPMTAMPPPGHPVLVALRLVEPVVTRQVGLIRRRGCTLSPAAQQLFDLFRERKGRLHGSP